MKRLLFVVFVSTLFTVGIAAQTPTTGTSTPESTTEKKKPAVFRPTKDQIKEVQTMLKGKKLYDGEADGKYNDPTRTGIKSFQKDNGLKETGTLNRATLEKFGVELTEAQKAIPVSQSSYASAETKTTTSTTTKTSMTTSTETKPKAAIFRATVDQIKAAQKLLKDGKLYSGEETGKLDDDTRAGLKKYQEANGVKVTGTLNAATLEKMGIPLTDKQKADAATATPKT